jgi:hypothetical protein
MKKREAVKLLKENGYSLDRKTKHEIWVKCGHEIAVSHGKTISGKMAGQIKSMIRNPVYKQEAYYGTWNS